MGVFACWIWRNDSLATALSQPVPQPSGVVSSVGNELTRCWDASEECSSAIQVVGLAGRHDKGQRPADLVGYVVNFGRPSAARSADGLLEVPPFAPAAERWALMWVESTAALTRVVLTTPLDPLRA